VAIASSGLYLSSNIGQVAGLSVAAAILGSSAKKQLSIALEGWEGREEVRWLFSFLLPPLFFFLEAGDWSSMK